MTLPLYLTDPGALATAVVGSRVDLTGPEARHAVTVRRTAVGDQVLVTHHHDGWTCGQDAVNPPPVLPRYVYP